jgi:hypothetical protein
MKIRYKSKGGHLDNFLSKLIGQRFSREIAEDKVIRNDVKIVKGVSVSFFSADFVNNDRGVFYKEDGQLPRTFLYLANFSIQKWKKLPVKHLFNCETVQQYTNFSIANQNNVDVKCRDTNRLHTNVNLITCGNCKSLFYEEVGKQLYGQDFNEIILDFEESDEIRNTQKGRSGYVTNWNEISSAYRETKSYQCEQCNFEMTGREGYCFMHVHHIDYDTTNNRRSNLQCLCIKCHANVDDRHRRNFSTIYQQREIQEFREKYNR